MDRKGYENSSISFKIKREAYKKEYDAKCKLKYEGKYINRMKNGNRKNILKIN